MTSKPVTTQQPAVELAAMHGKFLRFLQARVGDAATAEDILQSAYLKAMQHGAELRQSESSVAWFYRILRNSIIDHYRQSAVRSKAMEQWAAEWKEEYEPELKDEICACIHEAANGLKPEYREAIEQVDLAGKSVESFAETQHTTANNASVRLHRARKVIAKKLMEICGTCATHQCIDCTCKQKK